VDGPGREAGAVDGALETVGAGAMVRAGVADVGLVDVDDAPPVVAGAAEPIVRVGSGWMVDPDDYLKPLVYDPKDERWKK